VDEKLPVGTLVGQRWSILGSVAQLEKVVSQFQIEEVILASSAISSREKLLEIFRRYGLSRDVNVRLSSGLYEIITTGLSVHEFASVPLVRVNKVRLTGGNVALKLLLDYAVTVPVVVMIAPLLLLVALIIKLESPGPILYRRRVMGVNGRQFDAYKFRTMHINGDALLAARPDLQAELARHHKLKNDPRITRVGRILRRTSVDELPQLFNVLKAEMSLVGPRMIAPPEMEKYGQWGLNLLTVKPGITGLWQVSGRSNISYEERVQMDMHYVRNWSLWLDLQLLWQTFPAVFQGIGAY
jgi:exopolysaccharide biosynthesis polyprenyl glycosylphosphotransferase